MQASAIVIGGAGALGKSIIKNLKSKSILPISIDILRNDDAGHNLIVDGNRCLASQYGNVSTNLEAYLKDYKVSGVYCAAGGWMGGSIGDDNFLTVLQKMYAMNLETAALASNLSVKHLTNEGVLVLTGAEAALQECPGMVGYGISKVSTHYMLANLVKDPIFKNKSASAFAILPSVIDTPSNRKAMPDADHKSWTKPEEISQKCVDFITDPSSRPASGSMISVSTDSNGNTAWLVRPPRSEL
mmetsp:Transcript_2688/g.4040  ORF Transcript_2688/g.4040 Transcript_2688/m.4040 type:complete len:243 (+) Transcript_2688:45-773(+)|eukprot:CAMPEP_0185025578 /NCGR_PEP_ID=MMETSP1103-20130426/8479_1 /TAXON_ID=36769 /ORGANISM="Paraphysomonas bandaiensis, Strain Caron Lab Isolate" /LENGTH=242 /DNA_ID=CAMNT_0027558803 /DNA_START=40 /DNA_END=768 /DNA_ORIENTATION=+